MSDNDNIFTAILKKDERLLVTLMAKDKTLLAVTDIDGNTPLHHAVQSNYSKIILYLLKKGANIKAKNNKKETPIDLANLEIQKIFVHFFETLLSIPPEENMSVITYSKLIELAKENYARKDYRIAKIIYIEMFNRHLSANKILAITSLIRATEAQAKICQRLFGEFISEMNEKNVYNRDRRQKIYNLLKTTEMEFKFTYDIISENRGYLIPAKLKANSEPVLSKYYQDISLVHQNHRQEVVELRRNDEATPTILHYQNILLRIEKLLNDKPSKKEYYLYIIKYYKFFTILFNLSGYLITYYQKQHDYPELIKLCCTVIYHLNKANLHYEKIYYWELLIIFSINHLEQVLCDAVMCQTHSDLNKYLHYILKNLTKVRDSISYVMECYHYLNTNKFEPQYEERLTALNNLSTILDENTDYLNNLMAAKKTEKLNSLRESPILSRDYYHTYIAPQKFTNYWSFFKKDSEVFSHISEKYGIIELRI